MATLTPNKHEAPGLWFTYTPEQREQLIAEDIWAGKSVSGVLITVISIGLVLGVVTVAIILWG